MNNVIDRIHSFKRFGSKLGLDRMKVLLNKLGNPHKNIKTIHVAGTNGKGSVCRFIYTILQSQGYKVGLYTSPYLERFTERIEFDGCEITDQDLSYYASDVFKAADEMVKENLGSPTEFEIVTAIAFNYYKSQAIDFLILEVGLGGRGDATNVVDQPMASVITTIDFDHMEYLGDTLEKIAFEKAGIIKNNCPVVSSAQNQEALKVIRNISSNKNSPLTLVPLEDIQNVKYSLEGSTFDFITEDTIYKDLAIGMLGKHQIENAATAIILIKKLEDQGIDIKDEAVFSGLKEATQKGRFEIISENPLVIIDGAHNLQGMRAFKATVIQLFKDKKILLCLGLLKDKNVNEIVNLLADFTNEVIIAEPENDRKLITKELKKLLEAHNIICHEIADPQKASQYAMERSPEFDAIFFTGSLYLIGRVRSFFTQI